MQQPALIFLSIVGAYTYELAVKKHNYELEESDFVTMHLDYKNSGVGSNSCGPQLLPQYQMNDKEFEWEYQLKF